MTYATIPGDCTDRVTFQDGDGVIFERPATPWPAPSSIPLLTQTYQASGKTRREDQAGAQDVTDHSTEADLATSKLMHTISNVDVDAQVNTHALLKDEAVKELTETNTKSH